jgi:hypothetical protein
VKLFKLIAPILCQMTIAYSPLLNLFEFCSHLSADLGSLLRFRALSFG